ncbi:MAG: DUF2341 domain-containing protein [Candidatus Aenigmarchaeota archaeon]|nr:DUF2341 domain-containing protein [Candidatus Aenigmarchaeota archaeon]
MNKRLLLGIFFFSFIFLLNFNPSYAWLSGWQYRKAINITNSDSTTLTDYQVLVTLDTRTLISQGKMRSDCGDIRFANSTDYLLSYWIESGCNTNNTRVWVKVPSIPASSSTTIYVYYGNPSATSLSNGTAVFIRFDDFSYSGSPDTTKWREFTQNAYPTVHTVNGTLYRIGRDSGTTDQSAYIKMSSNTNTGLIIMWNYYLESIYGTFASSIAFINETTTSYQNQQIGRWSNSNSGFPCKDILGKYQVTVKWYKNGTAIFSAIQPDATTCSVTYTQPFSTVSNFGVGWYIGDGGWNSRGYVGIDDLRIAQLASPEPTASVSSTEELPNQPPAITIYLPTNTTYFYSNNFVFNFSVSDDRSSTFWVKAFLDGVPIYENASYQNNTLVVLTQNLSDGSHNFIVFANDTDANSPQTTQQSVTFTIRTIPQFQQINVTPTSFVYDAFNGIWFNTTIYDENNNQQSVILETNLTGVLKNYTLSNDTSTHYYYFWNIKPAAGTYVYKFYANDTAGNWNSTDYSTINVSKANSYLNLTASPDWTVYDDQSVTISCSVRSELNVTLYRDGTIISNPYTAKLPFGIYKIECRISDSQNYTPSVITQYLQVNTRGVGCLDNTTYAFYTTVQTTNFPIALNFTDLVNQGKVKKDLSDVFSFDNVSLRINTTKGYYVIVSNTTPITQFTINFGNYIANNSYPTQTLPSNVITPQVYEASYYYVVNLLNEKDGSQLLPPGATNELIVYCSLGSTRFPVNATKLIVPTKDQADMIRAVVTYSATEVYYRSLFVHNPIEYVNLYLVDANKDQLLQMIFKVQDLTGRFGNAVLKVKGYLGGSLRTFTEERLDIESKAITYLINGQKYQIFLDNGKEERSVGEIYPDPSSLEKTFVVAELTFTNYTNFNVSFSLTQQGNTIVFNYNDPTNQTISIEFFVLNASDANYPQIYYTKIDGRSVVNINYILPDNSSRYLAKVKIHHAALGPDTYEVLQFFGIVNPIIWFPLIDLGPQWLFLLFILPAGLIFTERTAPIGIFLMALLTIFFVVTGNIQVKVTVIALVIFLAILAEIRIKRRYVE